ncbi:MAG: transporter substrate-binding domain-containing protein [Granulosicoccus sp.]
MKVNELGVRQLENHSSDGQQELSVVLPLFSGSLTFACIVNAVFFICLTTNWRYVHAQDIAPVAIAWTDARPIFYSGESGALAGFGFDLAVELGKEIGFTPEFFRVSDYTEWGEAQATGRSMLLPGVAKLPNLAPSNSYSKPIVTTNVLLAIRVEEAEEFNATNLSGVRIATTPPGFGSDPALLANAEVVEFGTTSEALVALLSGSVDAISAPALLVFNTARDARIDHRIVFVGDAIAQSERVVMLHESRVELIESINAALARMEADGRLNSLRRKHGLMLPEPSSGALTVGVTDFPPYSIQNEDGTFSGFAVDSIRDLAALAQINLTFKAISDEAFMAGPTEDTYDILPQAGVSSSRKEYMDFTLPTEQTNLAIYTRVGEADKLAGLDDLTGKRVGVEVVNVARRLAQNHGGLDLHLFDGRAALLSALASDKVDAILFPSSTMDLEIEAQGLTGSIWKIDPPFEIIRRAPALRPGLGDIRERLNAVIPGYLISDSHFRLHEKYYGDREFWTQRLMHLALVLTAGLLLLFIGYLIWHRHLLKRSEYQAQQRELEREKRHSHELAALVVELERSNHELDEFAYIASHDLKEPLRGIAINANFLGREVVSEAAQQRIKRMVHLTTRMEQLISDILFYSRLSRGEAMATDVDPGTIIEGIRAELREWTAQLSGQIVVEGNLPRLHADRSKIKTVFQNLIVNGLKYNNSLQKTVTIGYRGTAVVNGVKVHDAFYVRDNGIGIDDKHHDKIFKLFARLNREDDFGPGTGAGLSFVRRVIGDYLGKVTVASSLGQGTTVYFTLPKALKQKTPVAA